MIRSLHSEEFVKLQFAAAIGFGDNQRSVNVAIRFDALYPDVIDTAQLERATQETLQESTSGVVHPSLRILCESFAPTFLFLSILLPPKVSRTLLEQTFTCCIFELEKFVKILDIQGVPRRCWKSLLKRNTAAHSEIAELSNCVDAPTSPNSLRCLLTWNTVFHSRKSLHINGRVTAVLVGRTFGLKKYNHDLLKLAEEAKQFALAAAQVEGNGASLTLNVDLAWLRYSDQHFVIQIDFGVNELLNAEFAIPDYVIHFVHDKLGISELQGVPLVFWVRIDSDYYISLTKKIAGMAAQKLPPRKGL
ncbi:MAG: hypothetical protein KBG15_16610 [Kofleriaceae bacterium]|nr:hypothetical protein [Kofleriaceae bacterium]